MTQGFLTVLGAQSTPLPTLPEVSAFPAVPEITGAPAAPVVSTAPATATLAPEISAQVGAAGPGSAGQALLSLPVPLAIALGVLMAVLVLGVLFLLVKNRQLRKKPEAEEKPESSGEITRIRIGKLHAQGAREYQQDCFAVSDPALIQSHGLLAIVADGMGGLEDGDKVSMATVETILGAFPYLAPDEPQRQLLELARQAVQQVNQLLGEDRLRRSGSTLVMGLLKDKTFSFLSMGDSHIYLLRDGALMLLNREHIFRNELALRAVNGELSLQEAYADERGSGLVSYVGMGPIKYIDMPAEPVAARPGDKFILMSDGIYNALEADELCAALAGDADEAARRLNELISAKGYANQDNYTGIILQCLEEEPDPEAKEV